MLKENVTSMPHSRPLTKTMPPMISIVGKSGSGKTTLLEKLIPELKSRGYRIGTVKHTHHQVEADQKGKDSYRLKAAGADAVILASPNRVSMVKDIQCDSLDSFSELLQDLDLVITEGYKRENRPKIEVFRPETGKTPLYHGQPDYVAIVTDAPLPASIPMIGLEQVGELADFIESAFLPGNSP